MGGLRRGQASQGMEPPFGVAIYPPSKWMCPLDKLTSKVNNSGMEKRVPTYTLDSIKEAARNGELNVTYSANKTVIAMGGIKEDLFQLVQTLSVMEHFYKSMTLNNDHRTWQDVYHIDWHQVKMYLKFMTDDDGYLVVSFKPKQPR